MQNLFNQRRICENLEKAQLPQADFLFKWCAKQIEDRLLDVVRDFPIAISTDGRTKIQSEKIRQIFYSGCDFKCQQIALPIKGADLIISPLCLHTENDLLGALSQVRANLKSGGLFIAAIPSCETLRTLRNAMSQAEKKAAQRIAPFPDAPTMAGLLARAGFANPVTDIERVHVNYANIFSLFKDLKNMGERNPFSKIHRATKGLFQKTQEIYPKDENGRIDVVFEIIFCIGWAGLR